MPKFIFPTKALDLYPNYRQALLGITTLTGPIWMSKTFFGPNGAQQQPKRIQPHKN